MTCIYKFNKDRILTVGCNSRLCGVFAVLYLHSVKCALQQSWCYKEAVWV